MTEPYRTPAEEAQAQRDYRDYRAWMDRGSFRSRLIMGIIATTTVLTALGTWLWSWWAGG